MTDQDLTFREQRFVDEYFVDPNGTKAAITAGFSPKAAHVQASKLLKLPKIQAALERRRVAAQRINALTVSDLLEELQLIVKADPRDLMEYYRGSCRYCHGMGHQYQRTPAEYARDLQAYLATPEGKKDPAGLGFPTLGGVGFRKRAHPNPECPECEGEGVGYSFVKDTRYLPRAAARLFAGIKETKEGLEIKTRKVDKLVELAMKNLGMLAEKAEGSEEDANPVPVAVTFEVVSGRKSNPDPA
jgi:phage terminase small subunit